MDNFERKMKTMKKEQKQGMKKCYKKAKMMMIKLEKEIKKIENMDQKEKV